MSEEREEEILSAMDAAINKAVAELENEGLNPDEAREAVFFRLQDTWLG